MSGPTPKKPRLPPRWIIHLFWITHRRLYRLSGGRVGLWRPKPGKWGAMRLTTIGRRTGRERPVIVGYFEDGSDLVALAMNGWGDDEPGWWLNLQAHPGAGRSGRWAAPGQGPRRPGRGARTPVGPVAFRSTRTRRLRHPPLHGDRGGDPGATARTVGRQRSHVAKTPDGAEEAAPPGPGQDGPPSDNNRPTGGRLHRPAMG